jgi:predicted kinase
MYQAATYLLKKGRNVILDGRTFTRRIQRMELMKAAREAGVRVRIIFCTAPDDVIRERLERDVSAGTHPAADRDFNLYLRKKALVEPFDEPYLELNTAASLDDLTRSALDWLNNQ